MKPEFKIQFSASAGTGKTYQVTQLYLALVLGHPYPQKEGDLTALAVGAIHPGGEPVPCEQVLMLTFSRNAAAELRQRITAGIEQARAEAEQVGQADVAARCWNLLHRLPAADIATIHAYAQRLVERHALRLGHSPAFSTLDEDSAAELRQEVFDTALRATLENGGAADRAVLEGLCAGRGTAEVLAALQTLLQSTRSLGLRLEEMEPEALIAQPTTPTLARLRELRKQLAIANGNNKRGKAPQILVNLEGLLATATAATDMVALAAQVAELADGNWGKDDAALSAARAALQNFGAYAEHRRAADSLPALLRLAQRAAQDYEDAKRERAGLDFDDLLLLARDLVVQHPDVLPPIAAIIVDEAQDNSALQNELIRGLQSARSAALALCGDRKQTIYAWRNADPAGLARIAKERGLHNVPLRQSFRSQQGVLDWVNDFCQRQLFGGGYGPDDELLPCPRAPATAPPNIELLLPEWELQPNAFDEISEGKPRLLLTHQQIKKLAQGKAGRDQKSSLVYRITLAPTDGTDDAQSLDHDAAAVSNPWKAVLARSEQSLALEARALARRIELLTAGPARAAGIEKIWQADSGTWAEPAAPPYRRRDILILLKATGRQEVYEAALRERGIPYTTDGKGRGFLTRQEVQDVASLLTWLAFPDDLVALLAVARSPFCALSDEALAILAQGGGAMQLAAALTGAEAATVTARFGELGLAAEVPVWDRAVEFFRRMRALAGRLSAVELAREAMQLTGFDATAAGSFHGAQRIANLKKLLSWIEARERNDGLDLAGVARWLHDEITSDEPRPDAPVLDPQDDAVRINTIHAAKGLTSPVVCVPDLRRVLANNQDWLLPHTTTDSITIAANLKTRSPDLPDAPHWNTSDFDTAKEAAKNSRSAEDGRLFYVAATRPRDLLIFSSENGHRADTWRGKLNAYLMEDAKRAQHLMTLRDYQQLEEEWRAAGLATQPTARSSGAINAAQLAKLSTLPARPAPAERYRFPATLLAAVPATGDATALARFLEQDLIGLDIPRSRRHDELSSDNRDERIATGVHAHAVLRDWPLTAAPAAGQGHRRPEGATTTAALDWLTKNCGGLPPRDVFRELPFVARFEHDGAMALVDGAADLVFLRDGVWHIVDYKFTDEAPEELLRRYALQLSIYGAALFAPNGQPQFAGAQPAGAVQLHLLRCSSKAQAWEIPLTSKPSPETVAPHVIAAARTLHALQHT